MHGARRVEGFHGLVGRHEILARAGLVAKAPDDNRRVVHARANHFHISGHVGGTPLGGVGERRLAVVVFVALDVGLGFEIDAEFVAKIEEIRVVGVVCGAHVVDVSALHHHHLFEHLLARDGVASLGIRLVAVHALQLQGAAIDVEIASGQPELVVFGLRVSDLHGSEADLRGDGLGGATLVVFQLGHEHVNIRLLGSPRLHGGCRKQLFH